VLLKCLKMREPSVKVLSAGPWMRVCLFFFFSPHHCVAYLSSFLHFSFPFRFSLKVRFWLLSVSAVYPCRIFVGIYVHVAITLDECLCIEEAMATRVEPQLEVDIRGESLVSCAYDNFILSPSAEGSSGKLQF
jgi:hypothetical protein